MALKNKTTGEYRKVFIDEVLLGVNNIQLTLYQNEEHREIGDEGFVKSRLHNHNLKETTLIEILCKHKNNDKLSAEDNFKVAIYNYLKTLEEYKDFEDC